MIGKKTKQNKTNKKSNAVEIKLANLNHDKFKNLKKLLEEKSEEFQRQASEEIVHALKQCYGDREISLQQLSATFRRGDLLEVLGEND